MKKIILYTILLIQLSVNAQFVGTPYIVPIDSRPVLDQVGASPSFAFSTRKLREAYAGFAVRLRRATDNSQIDVAFDDNGIVSDNSVVTLAVVGTSGASLGDTTTLSIYKGANPLYVTIWYDQGTNGYNGIQNTVAKQAVFSMASAGVTSQYASLLFSGSSAQNVIVNQNMQTLLGNVTAGKGLRGSICMVAKITANADNFSFGYDTGSIRWSGHMNWSDGNCYIDLGTSTDASRSFANGARLNLYKNYIYLRGNNYKTMRASGTSLLNNGTQNNNAGLSGGTFGVGFAVTTNSTIGFTGNIPEFILYPEPLTVAQYSLMENNQISFWGAN
jgi:hypothetical protein